MFDVVVIGNVGIDTNIYNYGRDITFDLESNFTENIDYIGQAGGYSARGFARLGYKTAFIGYIGDDYHGEQIVNTFNQDGINTEALFIDPGGTSRSINFMYPDGRRINFYDSKNHMTLNPDKEICTSILQQTKIVHFNIPNWARKLLPVAEHCGLKISCDLQDVVDLNDEYRADFIKYADIIFFSGVNFSSPQPVMESILSKYPQKILIAGMGAQGCALGTATGIQYFDPISMDLPVIDTNGAGDGLAVGFLSSYLLQGKPLKESILRAQIVARYTCTKKASSSTLMTMNQLNQRYSELKDQA